LGGGSPTPSWLAISNVGAAEFVSRAPTTKLGVQVVGMGFPLASRTGAPVLGSVWYVRTGLVCCPATGERGEPRDERQD